jgi:hypothetical protein
MGEAGGMAKVSHLLKQGHVQVRTDVHNSLSGWRARIDSLADTPLHCIASYLAPYHCCYHRTVCIPSLNSYRNIFPGFAWGVGAFAAYVIYDDFIAKKPSGGHH